MDIFRLKKEISWMQFYGEIDCLKSMFIGEEYSISEKGLIDVDSVDIEVNTAW